MKMKIRQKMLQTLILTRLKDSSVGIDFFPANCLDNTSISTRHKISEGFIQITI